MAHAPAAARQPTAQQPLRVLFVCLGNICRSPLAEGVFAAQVAAAGLEALVQVDSAGTGDWHVGELPDPRTRAVAQRHGLTLTHRARQFAPADFDAFDYVLCMDASNLRNVQALMPQAGGLAQVRLLRDVDPQGPGDVPDPYFGELEGFEAGYQLLHRVCGALLAQLRQSHGF